jgi:hypothetical protein
MRNHETDDRIILFWRFGCLESWLTQRRLRDYNIVFDHRLVPTNPLLPTASEGALINTPLLVIGDRAVYGYRPDVLSTLAQDREQRASRF